VAEDHLQGDGLAPYEVEGAPDRAHSFYAIELLHLEPLGKEIPLLLEGSLSRHRRAVMR
jgi:hypothetical protein